jgi:hypothetical protein
MTYKPYKFDNISDQTTIRFLPDDNNAPCYFIVKVYKLEVQYKDDRSYNLNNLFLTHGLEFESYMNRDRGSIIYHFKNEEQLNVAKFLV